jgi:hypothetical protein
MTIPTIKERPDASIVRSHKYAMMHSLLAKNEEEKEFLLSGAYLYWKEIERRGYARSSSQGDDR